MSNYEQLKKTAHLSGANATFVESLYETFLTTPDEVPDNWRQYFQQLKDNDQTPDTPRLIVQDKFQILSKLPKGSSDSGDASAKQSAVNSLIGAYRNSGHKDANIDPLNFRDRNTVIDLDYRYHNLNDSDLDEYFDVSTLFVEQTQMKLRDIIAYLKDVYTTTIGAEFAHIHDIKEKRWLQERLERFAHKPKATPAQKREILQNLVKGEGLEKYLHTRYVGQKRFSLEGGESLIPMMDHLLQKLGTNGSKEVVIGMAHRGRLNLLINILGKLPANLFDEFEGRAIKENTAGDVKYHMGFSSDVETPGGNLHLALAFNPSHLEIVNPVVQGSVRARMERRKKTPGAGSAMGVANEVVPIQIHGDAAFANQGVIQETLQLSQVRGYRVGGTVHIIINNQVGFTTSNPLDARSSLYCSDPAKMVQAPVIHVNGDDPEAVVLCAEIAADYIFKYNKDIVLDLVCYRRLGHNEADEPAITQPMMYKIIRSHQSTLSLYAEKLQAEGIISASELTDIQNAYKAKLDAGESVSRPIPTTKHNSEAIKAWEQFAAQDWATPVDTTYDKAALVALAKKTFGYPDSFTPHRIVKKLYDTRIDMSEDKQPCDWGFAENLAYATLLEDGYLVRLSGEDTGRGTFAHRHAVIHDATTGESYTPLANISPNQPSCRIIDSILSEEAVLGYEYGFSQSEPNALVIWEAQFGDFANGAQVLFDQFIASGEAKWERYCGLAVMLPHGYEGQGPEHSSARLERYLQLCAQNNMRVCMPTTPAQTFHMLRRQMKQSFRKPLIIMTPKSLLRHKLAVNTMDDLANGKFHEIIGEIDALDTATVKRIIFCSGKVYYDLLEKRREQGITNIAIIRIEELYPFPAKDYAAQIRSYPNAVEIVWAQEEPENQGSWRNIVHQLTQHNPSQAPISYIGRPESASTAAGYAYVHNKEQAALVEQALNISDKHS
ncbi:2-oxoglutarate dehydrogenase E1 component [Ostreibacterium oceani]|uniref:2-oxoglutarate dehydrogenase E1 component n=1 Tax=Ostreibacterium oceani TaxID=2654998 RepID=A0A6N7EU87_9GAMM|nr:2-oxoglutarate dehydrogenase E1 component [Ostreibacterium oceani]MPV85992.1 2-oxoglutarate dehydrogenase E1 component [Ostreibacterium oceani]